MKQQVTQVWKLINTNKVVSCDGKSNVIIFLISAVVFVERKRDKETNSPGSFSAKEHSKKGEDVGVVKFEMENKSPEEGRLFCVAVTFCDG